MAGVNPREGPGQGTLMTVTKEYPESKLEKCFILTIFFFIIYFAVFFLLDPHINDQYYIDFLCVLYTVLYTALNTALYNKL